MQKIFFFVVLVFSGITSFSQQEFFVYLQADNHQPFYAKINTRVYSSTENGYMIIPKLGDSTYEVVIGFAKNTFPEQSFKIPINQKDKGFQLKNLGDKGWVLVNMQNMSVIMNTSLPLQNAPEFSGIKKTDTFSEMLANVVNDSSILYTAIREKPREEINETKIPVEPGVINAAEKNEEKKDSGTITIAVVVPQITEPVNQEDTVSKSGNESIAVNEAPSKTNANSDPVNKNPENTRVVDSLSTQKTGNEKPFITRIEEKKSEGSYQAVYLEQYNFITDTIKISILSDEIPAKITSPVTTVEKKDELVPETKNIVFENTPQSKPAVIDTAASVKRAIQIINSDCKDIASDYDVDKLRVRLLNDKTIDDKLATARKYFKNKCLSVKQIKALTELFPNDETRYRFFDISYPFVSDTSNFYLLGDLIENDYYKNRFKAMISK